MIDIEIKIIINLLSYSILFFALSELCLLFKEIFIKKKFFKVIISILFIILTTIYSFNYTYLLNNGYIPQLFIIILLFGYLLYINFLKETFINTSRNILIFIKEKLLIIYKYLIHFVYSKKILQYFKNYFKLTFKKRNKNYKKE